MRSHRGFARTTLRVARWALPTWLLATTTGCTSVEHVTGWLRTETTRRAIDIPHMIKTGPEPSYEVYLRGPDGWSRLERAGRAVALEGGRRVLFDYLGGRHNVVIDETGRVVLTLPCFGWVPKGGTRMVCFDAPGPTQEDPTQRHVRVQVLSDTGQVLFDDTAPALAAPGDRYFPHGIFALLGLTSTGEVALREVHMPRTLDFGADRLARLFVLRGGQLVLIAQRAAAPERAYDAASWAGHLPQGFEISIRAN